VITCKTRPYHRFSFLVKDGYLAGLRGSADGRYLGRTCSVKTSGRMMTKDLPWGSHVMTSASAGSFRIDMSFWGKISLLLLLVLPLQVEYVQSMSRYAGSSRP